MKREAKGAVGGNMDALMSQSHPPRRGGRSIHEIAVELTRILRAMQGEYEGVLGVLAEQRQAVSKADAKRLERSTGAMGRHDLALRTLESTRRELMELALACGARERTVSGIASCADGSAGPALVESAANLRSCLQRVEREQGVLREAIGGVLGHVRGVWSQVERSMDQSGTYSSGVKSGGGGGRVPGGLAIDLTQ